MRRRKRVPVPAEKERSLWPHQGKALKYALQRRLIGLLMAMRLGKSEVAKRWARNALRQCPQISVLPKLDEPTEYNIPKVLIVAPLSTLPGWEGELALDGIKAQLLIGPPKRWLDLLTGPHQFYLTNYERLRACPGLVDAPWWVVILDESTLIRTPTSKIGKLVLSGFSQVPYRAILTGMPNPEDLMDFFNQMKFISPDGTFMECRNWYQFRDRHFNKVGWEWFPKRGVRDAIKAAVNDQCFVMTRKQAGVGNARVREVRYVDLPPKVWKAYRKAEKDFEIGEDETKWVPVLYTWLAKLTGGIYENLEHDAKVREVLSLLNNELKDEQVVIWFRFNAELFKVKQALKDAGISSTTITGAVPSGERGKRLSLFQKGKRRILLGQARCARFGVNCSAADTAIWYSRWPDGEINGQAQERIEHLSKKTTLLDIDIVVKDSIDEDLYKTVEDKLFESRLFTNNLLSLLRERKRGASLSNKR